MDKKQQKIYLPDDLKKEIKKYCVDNDTNISKKTEELWRKEIENAHN